MPSLISYSTLLNGAMRKKLTRTDDIFKIFYRLFFIEKIKLWRCILVMENLYLMSSPLISKKKETHEIKITFTQVFDCKKAFWRKKHETIIKIRKISMDLHVLFF